MGAPNLIADSMEYGLSYSVISYLKKLSQQVTLGSRDLYVFGMVLAKMVNRPDVSSW